MGVVIVDDDPLGRMRIRELLEEREDVVVAAECVSPGEAVAAITTLQPEILFLDVEMPRGSGLSVIEALGEDEMPAVVFVTAHERYALDAFAIQAVDYLLKPFARDRFERSVQRACAYALNRSVARARRAAIATPVSHGPFHERIAIRSGSGIAFVRAADLDWLESEGNYVRVHIGAESHLVRGTMNEAEEQLDGRKFARTHRSTIVNVDRIRQLMPSAGREYVIVLRDGTRVKLGAQYRENLRRLGFDF